MRKQLSKSEIKELNEQLRQQYGVENFFDKNDKVLVVDAELGRFITKNDVVAFFFAGEKPVPALKFLQTKNFLKRIVVDMGAVKFVANGADIMRPGIVSIDDGIQKDSFVAVVDQQHNKPLAVGVALLPSEEMRSAKQGIVVKNIHYVGDEIWNMK